MKNLAPRVPIAFLDPYFLRGMERVKEDKSYSPSVRFDLDFCWCLFELLGWGICGANESFPKEPTQLHG